MQFTPYSTILLCPRRLRLGEVENEYRRGAESAEVTSEMKLHHYLQVAHE